MQRHDRASTHHHDQHGRSPSKQSHSHGGDDLDHGHGDAHDDKKHSTYSEAKSARSSFMSDDDNSSARSYGSSQDETNRRSTYGDSHSERHSWPFPDNSNSMEDIKKTPDADDPHGHVHFGAGETNNEHLPPLPPTTKRKTRQSEAPPADLAARASWTTASFTEVPNALDELTHQEHHHTARPSAMAKHHAEHDVKLPPIAPASGSKGSLGDLHSVLAKHPGHQSILTKYLRPVMTDEGTQAGIPSWDWLSRLEQMLIHFFLMIFESSDDSKPIMEILPYEAGSQVEEIFQLLLKADPEMYKELGHLVSLAEKWLIFWRGNAEEREKALDFVRLYIKGVKDKNYYRLPIQVRLHKLGAFIAGLKLMGSEVPLTYPIYKQQAPINQPRVDSPRVKPATHFSRVVANILCGRACEDPLPLEDIYADQLGRSVFQNTLHGDVEFKTYTDQKYGQHYTRNDIFSKGRPRKGRPDGDAGDNEEGDEEERREDCVQNLHCWIPRYTKSYVDGLEGHGCEVFAKAEFAKGVKLKSCRAGVDPDGSCKHSIKIKSKKLYDWVRGPDGKVYRRPVGSYTELGNPGPLTGSLDRLQGRDKSPRGRVHYGGKGGGGFHNSKSKRWLKKVGGKGKGYTQKAHSDTRLGKDAYSSTSGSRGRTAKSPKQDSHKEGMLSTEKQRRTKETMDVFRVDNMSADGSGDSGNEAINWYKPGGTGSGKDSDKQNKGQGKGGAASASTKSKGVTKANKFGTGYHGPSHYKSKTNTKQGDGESGRYGYGNSKYPTRTQSAIQRDKFGRKDNFGGRGDNYGRKDLVDLYSKKHSFYNRRDTDASNRTNGRKGRYDEYDGEGGYAGWSPNSDYSNYLKDYDYNNMDDPQMLSINQCWEKASKFLKKPCRALVIPPAENLMMYLEKKFPRARWPRGMPVATRHFPNGQLFVAQFRNGSSKVYYPHGGLAVAISGPSPVTSQILVVRDPADHIFFFDKALLADLNSSGKGTIYGDDGVVQAQYSAIGGFKVDGLENGQRWQWNQGGQRMIMKLNRYMSLRLSDFNRIFLNFYGNRRGFLVNVASGRDVTLMNPDKKHGDPLYSQLKSLIRPKTAEDTFDYMRGQFNNAPTLGFVDKEKHFNSYEEAFPKGSMSARHFYNDDGDDDDYGYNARNQSYGGFGNSNNERMSYANDHDLYSGGRESNYNYPTSTMGSF